MVVVETYRGFDIMFSPDKETFSCIPSDEDVKESKSFAACKKHIDDYLKDNQNFISFNVQVNPENYRYKSNETLTIVGIRKDKRFIYEKGGEKAQLSTYDEGGYIIVYPENTSLLEEYNASINRENEFITKEKEARKDILSKMKIKTLRQYKEELLGK